jgi:hypothetical protein
MANKFEDNRKTILSCIRLGYKYNDGRVYLQCHISILVEIVNLKDLFIVSVFEFLTY